MFIRTKSSRTQPQLGAVHSNIGNKKNPRNFPIEKTIFIKLTLFKSGRNTTKTVTSLTNLVLLFQKYKNMFT